MSDSVISKLFEVDKAFPSMSWHLEGDQLVMRVWLLESDAKLLRAGREMFSPRS